MRYLKMYIPALVLFLAMQPLFGQMPAKKQSQTIALTGATVHPVSAAAIENGTVVFQDGKITAVGAQVDIPAGAIRIDVSGKHVWPAMFEANTNLGLSEISSTSATRDFAELGDLNPNVRAEVAINPESVHFPVTRANGIGVAISRPMGGIISGQAAVVFTDGWTWEEMTLKSGAGMVVNFPRLRPIRAWWMTQTPAQQMKRAKEQIAKLTTHLEQAAAYAKTRSGDSQEYDSRLEAMLPVMRGEMPLLVYANELRQIQKAVEIAKQFDLRMVLVGGQDAWRAIDLLKTNNVPVIVTPVNRLPARRDEAFDTPFALPAKLQAAGVKYAIARGSRFGNARDLPYNAGKAVAYGLSQEDAMRSITLSPAEIFGLDDRIGSLDAGKDANIMVTRGNPLEIMSQVEHLFIQGKKIDLDNKQRRLYEKYQEKYRRSQP